MTRASRFQTITPPNLIAAKVTGSGGVDAKALRRAESAIAALKGKFEFDAQDQIGRLKDALARAADEASEGEALAQIIRIAHDLKGQGGTFGYDLLSRIGDTLCRYAAREERSLSVLTALVDAMAAVISRRIEGDGGPVGREIIQGLRRLTGTGR